MNYFPQNNKYKLARLVKRFIQGPSESKHISIEPLDDENCYFNEKY